MSRRRKAKIVHLTRPLTAGARTIRSVSVRPARPGDLAGFVWPAKGGLGEGGLTISGGVIVRLVERCTKLTKSQATRMALRDGIAVARAALGQDEPC